MPRGDPRTQRGLSVIDLMRRLPADQRAAAENGLRIVREMQRRGLASPDLGVAIQQLNAAKPEADRILREQELQASAEREAIGFASRLTDQDLQIIDQLHQYGGWDAVAPQLAAAGLSQAGLEVLTSTYRASGGNLVAVRQAVSERIQRDAVEAEASKNRQDVIDRNTPTDKDAPVDRRIKEGSPLSKILRDPAFHASADAWYAERAAELEAEGVGKAPGQSAAAWLVATALNLGREGNESLENNRMPFGKHYSSEEAMTVVSKLFRETKEAIQPILDGVHNAASSHEMMRRALKDHYAERDQRDARVRAHVTTAPLAKPEPRPKDSVRASLEKAAKATGMRSGPEPYLASTPTEAVLAVASGREVRPATKYAREATQKVLDRIQNPEPDNSVRAYIERADAALNSTDDDNEGGDL